MKTIIIHKHDNTERHISIEADAEDTAFIHAGPSKMCPHSPLPRKTSRHSNNPCGG